MAFIEFKNVSKSFGPKKVLDNLCLSVQKGETLTILGGSGSGKTILLKIFLGLLPLDAGHVFFDGKEVSRGEVTSPLHDDELLKFRQRVGMLFQGGALFDSLSVKENVAYPLREHFQLSEEEIAKRVTQKLQFVGLPDAEKLLPGDLSGGMKKRVALARAMATDPEVILYDEPTTGLDPINTTRINHLIRHLQKEMAVTSLVVTHDIYSAMMVSDRLALLDSGKIIFIGTKEEMKASKNPLIKEFLSGGVRADA